MVYFLLFPDVFLQLLFFLLQFKTEEGEGKTQPSLALLEKKTMTIGEASRKNEDLNRSKNKAFLVPYRFFFSL